jgi:NADH-quinone oxidoreductase subunit A
VNFVELKLAGFVEMVLFIAFVLAGFFYVIKKGALKWE